MESIDNKKVTKSIKTKIRKTREAQLDSYALSGNSDKSLAITMKSLEEKKLNEILGAVGMTNNLPTDLATKRTIISTVEDLKEKVLKNLEKALDHDEAGIWLPATFQSMKYLFEPKKTATSNRDNIVNVSFANIEVTTKVDDNVKKIEEHPEIVETTTYEETND